MSRLQYMYIGNKGTTHYKYRMLHVHTMMNPHLFVVCCAAIHGSQKGFHTSTKRRSHHRLYSETAA